MPPMSFVLYSQFFYECHSKEACHRHPKNMREVRDRIRNHITGNKGTNSVVASLVNRIESRLTASTTPQSVSCQASVYRKPIPKAANSDDHFGPNPNCQGLDRTNAPMALVPKSPMPEHAHATAKILFATHDTWGILDTGAMKTVMGSHFVSSFLQTVHADVRKNIRRCPCDVTFRFGNQGTLKSEHAMVVPVCGLDLKIAVGPGATPFLVSNTLLRALGAMVDLC